MHAMGVYRGLLLDGKVKRQELVDLQGKEVQA